MVLSTEASTSFEDASPLSNSAITSAEVTVSPAFFTIFLSSPSKGATTSSTTLSVSISAITSSCETVSPSCLIQFAIVPSITDSGKVGDLISVLILFSPKH